MTSPQRFAATSQSRTRTNSLFHFSISTFSAPSKRDGAFLFEDIMDVSQLPQEIQDALPQRNDYNGANAGPVTPGTGLPLPPNMAANASAAAPAPEQPDVPSYSPGSLADKIASAFLEHVAARQPAPPANSEAGQRISRAQQVAGAAQGVLSSLGDAAHAHDTQGGWLSGALNVLNARNQRIAQTNQQQFENTEQKRKDDALIARNQVETLQLVRNIYRQDQETRTASYAQGKAFVDSLRGDHAVTDNVTQSDLNSLIQKNPSYLQSHYVRPVGEEPVLDGNGAQKIDANGNPVFSPMYSLVDRNALSGGTNVHKVSPDESSYFKTNLGKDYPVGTPLTIDQYTALSGQAHKVADTTAMIDKDRETALTDAQRSQLRSDLADDNIQHYIASVPGSALGGLYAASKNADDNIEATQKQIQAAQQKGDQNAVQQLQQQLSQFQDERVKVNRVISSAFSEKDREDYAKEVEKAQHDHEIEADKAKKAADAAAAKADAKTQKTVANYNKTIDQNTKRLNDLVNPPSDDEKKNLQSEIDDARTKRDTALGINTTKPPVTIPNAPPGTKFVAKGSDGKMHYLDADHKDLGIVK
jgi:hypothetical protein